MKKVDFYIPSLDGIRALAVLLVFAGHAGLGHIVPGGFGVTVFFFLSGFLITTLLRREFQITRSINYKHFVIRRIYRILPPAYLVLLFAILLGLFGVLPHNMDPIAIMAQIAQLTNYYAILIDTHHFAPGTTVMWSLAVEEHFYLFFPLLFLFFLNRVDRKKILAILIFMSVIVLLWRCYLVFGLDIGKPYTYKATDTRIDSILFGCMLGVWFNPVLDKTEIKKNSTKIILLIASVSILLFCFFYRAPEFRQSFRYTLQGIALLPLFFMAVKYHRLTIFKWLDWKLLRGIGIISYTMYLIHMIAIRLAEQIGDNMLTQAVIAFIFTIGFSVLMYYLIEKKMGLLRKKLHSENK